MATLMQIEVLLPELRAYARSLTGDPGDTEDLVHDAVERTLRTDQRPSKLSDLRPWIFRVIRNLHLDELRKRRVRQEYGSKTRPLLASLRGQDDHARDLVIRLAFERLPAEKREILFLVDVMGMKYAEAAEVMGIATGTVMSRLSRARKALREEAFPSSTPLPDRRREGGRA